ncbi:MAG: hypothetical protein LQ339_001150 [Xanthoria mediterranea]|nr:MAG: hypothetical protein LQ339_001150 [Xanthoria mediterranea]
MDYFREKMPALFLTTKHPPQDKPTINKNLIAYFSTSIGTQTQRYMTFESGFALLCTLISARSRFRPKPGSNVDRLEYDHLQKNVEEVVMGLVVEAPKPHTMHLAHSVHVFEAIEAARERFWGIGVEAPELAEMERMFWRGGWVSGVGDC